MKKLITLALVATLAIPFAGDAMAAESTPGEQKQTPAPVAGSDAQPAAPVAPAAVTVTAPSPATATKTVRLGYVDMIKAATDCAQGKAAFAEMKKKSDKYKNQIEAKQKQLEKQKAAIEAKIETMTPMARTAKAKEFQKKVEEYQKFVQNAEKDMRDKEEAFSGKLYKAIENAAADYGKANGFAAVVVKKEMLYVGENVDAKDLTDEIVKAVDAADTKK